MIRLHYYEKEAIVNHHVTEEAQRIVGNVVFVRDALLTTPISILVNVTQCDVFFCFI